MNDNPYAFPVSTIDGFTNEGMTLRDWFAGQALVSVIAATSAGQHHPMRDGRSIEQGMAFDAYSMADAMLAERAKP